MSELVLTSLKESVSHFLYCSFKSPNFPNKTGTVRNVLKYLDINTVENIKKHLENMYHFLNIVIDDKTAWHCTRITLKDIKWDSRLSTKSLFWFLKHEYYQDWPNSHWIPSDNFIQFFNFTSFIKFLKVCVSSFVFCLCISFLLLHNKLTQSQKLKTTPIYQLTTLNIGV